MAVHPQVQAVAFQLALLKFQKSLSDQEKRSFGVTTLHDLHVAIEVIQRKQKSEKKLRAMGKLAKFLEGMKEYDKIVTVFLNTSELLAFIWGPMKFLLQRIGEHLYLLTQYEAYFKNQPHMCHPLTLIYEDILNFHGKAMRFFKKRMWQQLFQALWKTFEFEFGAILRNMREHMTLIQSQATITQFTEVLRLQETAKLAMERQQEAEAHRRRDVVRQWLCAANCEADQETFAGIRHKYPTTGLWIFQDTRFSNWFDSTYCLTHLLWLNGIPGAASLIVEEARKLQNASVIFFYCRYLDNDRSTFLGVARGLLSQLLLQDDDLLSYIHEKASSSGQTVLSTESIAKELLTTSIKNSDKLYVIIDGLDECERDERKTIVTFFEEIWASLPQDRIDSLRCLFLSQDDNVARKDFENITSLKITQAHNKKDITAYAETRSLEIKLKFGLTTDRQLHIQELIQCAVSIDLDAQIVDWDRRRFSVDSKELCGSLAEIHTDGTLNLVHHTAKRYLVDEKVVNVEAGELELANLCVSYLAFPCFEPNNGDAELEVFAPLGHYGFLDYAYALWSRHLDACLRLPDLKDSLQELREATEVFIETHWTEPDVKPTVRKPFIERWKPLESNNNLDRLVLAAWLAQRQLLSSAKLDPRERVLTLSDTIAKVRGFLEKTWETATQNDDFEVMYGSDMFKCPRVNCTRFYNGFRSRQLRDDHAPKHERAFFCSFPGCAMATLGCATLKELHKHEAEYHGTIDVDDEDAEYPEMPPQKVSFQCTQCDAVFTRNNNLKIHMRKHNAPNQKQFICSQCGKPFARQGDRTRHESTTHSGSRSHVCGGTLKNGSLWGCGQEFNRGDTLSRHWKSEKGKNCLRPKEQEEAAESANSISSAAPSNVGTPNT
ncbi:hypothetical protein FB567DRAFT_438198 [Paraphoma chrysanthemicola]|uniref:C2H2-type domain-containing protein n=1 Tax=Paraphoma chrysanthemicola TaxID=798071 RepID=A0A8K0W218_9PLEO|nr:hypothetical protein FB567DRAFT_438198 [Paraphoma chrysanthemicola]